MSPRFKEKLVVIRPGTWTVNAETLPGHGPSRKDAANGPPREGVLPGVGDFEADELQGKALLQHSGDHGLIALATNSEIEVGDSKVRDWPIAAIYLAHG